MKEKKRAGSRSGDEKDEKQMVQLIDKKVEMQLRALVCIGDMQGNHKMKERVQSYVYIKYQFQQIMFNFPHFEESRVT